MVLRQTKKTSEVSSGCLAGELAFTALYSARRWRSTGEISLFHFSTIRKNIFLNRTHILCRKVSIPYAVQRTPSHGPTMSLNSIAPEDDNRRTIGHKRAVRASLNNFCKFASIKNARVTSKFCFYHLPHLPRWMRYVIFDATITTSSLSRITPVVFGDELFQASLFGISWK